MRICVQSCGEEAAVCSYICGNLHPVCWIAIQGMSLQVLLCLCLVGNIQLSSEEPPAPVNDIHSSGPFTNNFTYKVTNSASGENSTINNDTRTSDTDTVIFINNFSSTNTSGGTTLIINTHSTTPNQLLISNITGIIDTVINEIESPVIDTTTEVFISTTGNIQLQNTATSFSDLPEAITNTNHLSSRTIDTTPEETPSLINDKESAGTETTTVATTAERAECEVTTTTSISENYEEIIHSAKYLDDMFETTVTSCHEFILTKNQTIGESIISLATDYLKMSKKFVESVELQNKIIRCRNNTASENYKIGNIYAYEQNVEIVEIVSDELGKMMGSETVYTQPQDDNVNQQNHTEGIMTLLDELLSVVTLTQKLNKLGRLSTEQYKYYQKSLKVGDLDKAMRTTKESMKINQEILQIINNSKSMKYLYDDEHISKSSLTVKYLVNSSYLEANLKKHEDDLTQAYEEHDIEEALFQLNEVIRPIVLGVIFIVGITLNGILLLVFVNHEDMRTGPNVMVINLNICDILGLTVNILLYIFETLSTDWTLGSEMCKLYRFARYLTIGLSVYSVVAISVQRFVVLTEFFSLGVRCQFFGKFVPAMNVLIVWVLSSVLATPRAIKAYVDKDVCWSASMTDPLASKFIYVDLALYCVIPFIIILLTSGISSVRLKSSVKHMPGEALGKEKVINSRVLSANIFLGLIIVFAFCYMPYFLFSVFSQGVGIDAPFMTVKYSSSALYCLIHSNSIFNPIALYIASAKYRKYMKPYLCFGYSEKKTATETSVSSNITIDTRM